MNGTRLPEDWKPTPSQYAWAKGRRPDLNIDELIEDFSDYWLAKSGKDATKLDWGRTFKRWVRNARGSPVLNAKVVANNSPSVRNKQVCDKQVSHKLTPEQCDANLNRLASMVDGLVKRATT